MRFVSAHFGDPGARTRIQSGLRWIGWSAPCAFSGWRGRASLFRRSRTTAMGLLGVFRSKACLVPGGLLAVVFKRQLMLLDFVVQRLLRQPERLASRSNTSILLTQFVLNQAALELAHLVRQRGGGVRRPG